MQDEVDDGDEIYPGVLGLSMSLMLLDQKALAGQ